MMRKRTSHDAKNRERKNEKMTERCENVVYLKNTFVVVVVFSALLNEKKQLVWVSIASTRHSVEKIIRGSAFVKGNNFSTLCRAGCSSIIR
ncbi:unnamed protein product [Nesidiocoris tenuis]|uniref:Uncharacterized protein n=1 Tax=Nesidiocoris tenuis TaxID=355587 RepID=A0A6H5HLU8_9HEMI|nr:unnamed protein product [Nesidiocoris tenuis]